MIQNDAKIHIFGGHGMVGSAIMRELSRHGFKNLSAPSSREVNLTRQSEVEAWFEEHRPEYVFMTAAKVGGIYANSTYRADFITDNTLMSANTIKACHDFKVRRLQYLGSSCIYPKFAPQPVTEEALLTSQLEETNEPYALAKILGLKMIENYRRQYGDDFHALMPTNLYGPNDNYHPENSHVIPGLIQRMHKTMQSGSREFEVWGSGFPRREFLHVDDLARACVHIMQSPAELPYWMNVGTGEDLTIRELAEMIADAMGFKGNLKFNTQYPDGTPRKLLDVAKIKRFGWEPRIPLREGIQEAVESFLKGQVR